MQSTHSIAEEVFSSYQKELIENGAIGSEGLQEPDLPVPIHPLFGRSRWIKGQGTSKDYERLEPALQLASALITTDCLLPWWSHLTWGIIKFRNQDGEVYLADSDVEGTRSGINKVKKNLNTLAENLTLTFAPQDHESAFCDARTTYGWTTSDRKHLEWDVHPDDWPSKQKTFNIWKRLFFESKVPVVVLNRAYLNFLTEDFEHASLSTRYRFYFMFATTLAHEISHAYWMFFRGAESDFHEPLHQQGDQKCELGFSWEQWAFGHQINPLSFLTGRRVHEGPLTTSLVLQFRDGEETTSRKSKFAEFPGVTFEPVSSTKGGAHWITNLTYPTNTRTIWRAVPMEWIAEWFSKSVWDQRSKLELGMYRPPDLGPGFMVNLEAAKDCRLTAFVGVKDENFSRARLANEAILHDLGRQMFSEDDEHAEVKSLESGFSILEIA